MNIVILGGGISGLSAAWALRKKHPDASITILEKQDRLGGWAHTLHEGGFFFEGGPRTFQAARCPKLLHLIQEVGLQDEIIYSDPCAKRRFLYVNGRLRSMASFIPMILPALICEPFIPRSRLEDESVYDFAKRRFGKTIASTLFDALCLGIYAAPSQELSIRSCFPFFFQIEKEKGSLVLSMLFSKSKKKNGPRGLFSLRHGVSQLIQALGQKCGAKIHLAAEVERLTPDGVFASGKFYPATQIISALPGSVIGKLTGLWTDFQETNLDLVHLAFAGDVLPKKGFGYLVPSKEKENLLGMVWDSAIFPEQSRQGETRITAMMRHGSIEAAKEALSRHLGVAATPIYSTVTHARGAVPLFKVGYSKRLERFQEEAKAKYPTLSLVGNYIQGAAVESCIALSNNL